MGFFPGMVTPPKAGYETYLVQVSNLGECVIQHLTADGKVDGFVVAESPAEMIEDLAMKISANATVSLNIEDRNLVSRWTDGIFSTWREVVDELNRQPRRRDGHILDHLYTRHTYCRNEWVTKYVRRFRSAGRVVHELTPAGLAFDAKHFPQKPPDTPPLT